MTGFFRNEKEVIAVMGYTKITVETRGHVFLMGLNRAEKRNAFDLEMYEELASAYGELHRNSELRCGVLFAHGDHFTTGLELDKWASVFTSGKWTIPEGCIHPLGIDSGARCKNQSLCQSEAGAIP
jgi:enoyl-CoA hydratase